MINVMALRQGISYSIEGFFSGWMRNIWAQVLLFMNSKFLQFSHWLQQITNTITITQGWSPMHCSSLLPPLAEERRSGIGGKVASIITGFLSSFVEAGQLCKGNPWESSLYLSMEIIWISWPSLSSGRLEWEMWVVVTLRSESHSSISQLTSHHWVVSSKIAHSWGPRWCTRRQFWKLRQIYEQSRQMVMDIPLASFRRSQSPVSDRLVKRQRDQSRDQSSLNSAIFH